MGCRTIFTAAVIAASLLGADASPCKPATSNAASIFQSETPSTVISEATSTALVKIPLTFSTEATSDALTETTSTAQASSSTVQETTLATLVETTPTVVIESSSTGLMETTPTTLGETTPTTLDEAVPTTSTVPTEESSTTLAANTVTTEAEACVETQVIINPGFDDDTKAPWVFADGVIRRDGDIGRDAYSPPNALYLPVRKGESDATLSQKLYNLKGRYRLYYHYKVRWTSQVSLFGCKIQPKIGDNLLSSGSLSGITDSYWDGLAEWSTAEAGVDQVELTFAVACSGNFVAIDMLFDDITLTKVCDADLNPSIE